MINPGLKNRAVLVTGTDNPFGIGAAIGAAFAEAGAVPFLHCYESIDDRSPGAACSIDFTDPSSVTRLFDEAERRLGPIEVLVNNAATWSADTFVPAGTPERSPWLKLWSDPSTPISVESITRHFLINGGAPALLMREFARRHVQRGATWGRIVNISTDGSDGFPSEVSYGASKFALESYTRAAAHELGVLGITVNVLALGPVQTGWITPALEKALLPTIPVGRLGTPRDVADVVVFLGSEQARWVTGQRIFVGGGHRM